MNNYMYGGFSDVGFMREINEDYISAIELDNTTLFAVIADGQGSKASSMQPASIAATEMNYIIRRVFKQDKELLLENPEVFLAEAMQAANRVIGAFKSANEELYAGFGSSVTCCLMWEGGHYSFAHAGNTRLYLIKFDKQGLPKMIQLTKDHTKARKLYDDGIITLEQYHTHPDRLVLNSGLGEWVNIEIQTYTDVMKPQDFILMTTDGIHYAVTPNPIMEFVVRSESCEDAAHVLIDAAKSQKYVDNMSALIIWRAQ